MVTRKRLRNTDALERGTAFHLEMESLFNEDPATYEKLAVMLNAVGLLKQHGIKMDEGSTTRMYVALLRQWPALVEAFNPWLPIHKFPLGEQLELEHEIAGVGKHARRLTFNMDHQLFVSTLDAELPSVPVPVPWTARARYLCVEGEEE